MAIAKISLHCVLKINFNFSLVNIQPAVSGYGIPLTSARYWSTDVFKTKYFNDLIYFI